MLSKFKVKNFKSFNHEFTLDLSRPKSYEFNADCIKNGVVNSCIVHGYNGSGKSNLGLAIFDLVGHATDRNGGDQHYENYIYAGLEGGIAEFEYSFVFDGTPVIYKYGKFDHETIAYEELIINNKNYASIDRQSDSKAIFDIEGAEGLNRDLSDTKISIINYIKNNSVLPETTENTGFINLTAFLEGMLFFRSMPSNVYIGYSQGSSSIVKHILNSPGGVKGFEEFLKNAGISCELGVADGDEGKYITMNFGENKLNFLKIASQGTKSLTLFYYWYLHFKSGDSKVKFIFIDEFDAFYHHELSMKVINILKSVGAQFIITTHNTAVMSNDIMRPDCYFYIDQSGINPLPDRTQKELREAHNIEKMYRAGAFDE